MNQVKGKIQTENGRKSYTENLEPEPTGCTRRAGSEGCGFCARISINKVCEENNSETFVFTIGRFTYRW